MAYETLLFAREESFAVITLNRPPANAISEPLMRELNAALNAVESDDAVRAVIITGAGDRIFCAGADLGLGLLRRRRRHVHSLRQRRRAARSSGSPSRSSPP